MKKAYIIIISCVAALCVIVGSWVHIRKGFTFLKNHVKISSEFNLGNISDVLKDLDDLVEPEDLGDNMEREWDFETDEVKKIKIDATVADLVVKEGSSFKVGFDGYEKYEPEVKTDSTKTLIVKQPSVKRSGVKSLNNKIVVCIPADAELEKITIVCNVGDVEITDVIADEFDVRADVGEVHIDMSSAGECEIVAAVGEVGINGGKYDYIKCTANVGEVHINECDFNELKAKADVGEVRIDLIDARGNYNFDLSASLGGSYLNDKSVGKNYKENNIDAKKYITVDASIGGIEINGK